jgi:hypothetical protein
MARRAPESVGVEELKDAVLHMIVARFDGRPHVWVIATEALSIAAFDSKQAALRTTRR